MSDHPTEKKSEAGKGQASLSAAGPTDPDPSRAKVPGARLIPCEDCGRMVSRRARTCPGCGLPLAGPGPAHRIFNRLLSLAAIVAVGILAWQALALIQPEWTEVRTRQFVAYLKSVLPVAGLDSESSKDAPPPPTEEAASRVRDQSEGLPMGTPGEKEPDVEGEFPLPNLAEVSGEETGSLSKPSPAVVLDRAPSSPAGEAELLQGMKLLGEGGADEASAEAIAWLHQAAKGGNAEAQFQLGLLSYDGRGGAQDFSAAMDWFLRAARQWHGPAQANLAVMLYRGQGDAPDRIESCKWAMLASDENQANARQLLQLLAGELSEEQVREAAGRAEDWKEAHPRPTLRGPLN